MSKFRFHTQPELRDAVMIAAWSGWSDAALGATWAIEELVSEFHAQRFASINHQSFTVFTDNRPMMTENAQGKRQIVWPRGEFYFVKTNSPSARDLVFFRGDEPDLQWDEYAAIFAKIASACDIGTLVRVGAMHDSVPHTRATVVSAYSDHGGTDRRLNRLDLRRSDYQGPVSIGATITDLMSMTGVACVSYWAHNPHYLQNHQNPELSIALCKALMPFLPSKPKLNKLRKEVTRFQAELNEAFGDEQDLREYVAHLEEKHDAKLSADLSPAAAINEAEHLLRRQRHADRGKSD